MEGDKQSVCFVPEINPNDLELDVEKHNNGTTEFTKVSKTSRSHAGETAYGLHYVQQSLKDMYLTKFKKFYPFSLPFTFDIKNTWVSWAFKEENKDSQATEDHVELLKTAFDKAKMLIIEGDPATGKTSLMQKLAYEWAKEKQELLCYDLVLYAEFREVREKTFQSIADLVLYYSKTLLKKESYEILEKLMNNERFCEEHRILILLDGYDESSLEKQCSELETYLFDSMIETDKALTFNVVITTRKGYLSNFSCREGRFVFAEVLGFTTKQQKEKYIFNHFQSTDIDNQENIAAVNHLLDSNENFNKLAETPLFLSFICLVRERITDGTLLELYCNIIWWLIDRHQKNYPDQNIPNQFEFQTNYSGKFKTIQDHYLHFPQLLSLGKMALHNLKKNVFIPSDYEQFNLQPVIEQVGLLRREKKYNNSLKLVSSFFFPHRTIQEFLAACYFFCSNDPTNEWLLPNSAWNTSLYRTKEFERFLLRIALSNNMPVQPEKCKLYFENIIDIDLNTTFDAFRTPAGFNSKLLNWFLSQCTNALRFILRGIEKSVRHVSSITPKMSIPPLLSFSDLKKLRALEFWDFTSEGSFQLSFRNCPSLKKLEFWKCEMESSAHLSLATLPAIDTVHFIHCKIDLATWQSITDQIKNSSVKCLKLAFGGYMSDFKKEFLVSLQKCDNVEQMEIMIHNYEIFQNDLLSFSDLMKLCSVEFGGCTFEANSQLSITNCPSLKNLTFCRCKIKSGTNLNFTTSVAIDTVRFDDCKFDADSQLSFKNCSFLKKLEFWKCEMESSADLCFATLPAIDTVEFDQCKSDLATWQSVTDQIKNSSVNCLKVIFGEGYLSKESLIHLQKYRNVEKVEITLHDYKISNNDLLSFSGLMKLHSLIFSFCTFEANSQLSITNCSSLKNLVFWNCEMKSSTNIYFATLPTIDTVEFHECITDLATWQSIIDEIQNSSIRRLKLTFGYEFKKEFLIHLQKCVNFEQMEITIQINRKLQNDLLSFSDLVKLHSVKFDKCSFKACYLLSITNCPSLRSVIFSKCKFESSTIVGIATLPAIDTVEFYGCKIDLTAWQSITAEIRNSSVKCLILSVDFFAKETCREFLHHLQKCECIQRILIKDAFDDDPYLRDSVFYRYEEVTANLAQTAQILPGLSSITIIYENLYGRRLPEYKRLNEGSKERILQAGRERNPGFLIEYVE